MPTLTSPSKLPPPPPPQATRLKEVARAVAPPIQRRAGFDIAEGFMKMLLGK
jgi:hypothetical protein